MSPNLFLATQKLFSPHKWFRENKSQERSLRKTEHWAEPTPGLYEYIPGRGWYLIAKEKEAVQETTIEATTEGGPVQAAQEPQTSYEKLALPVSVHWSRVLKRYMLEPTYKDRKQHGVITNDKGRLSKEEIERMLADAEKYKEEDEAEAGRIQAKNGLESYAYSLKNTVSDPKVEEKLSSEDKEALTGAIDKTVAWIDENQTATKEEVSDIFHPD